MIYTCWFPQAGNLCLSTVCLGWGSIDWCCVHESWDKSRDEISTEPPAGRQCMHLVSLCLWEKERLEKCDWPNLQQLPWERPVCLFMMLLLDPCSPERACGCWGQFTLPLGPCVYACFHEWVHLVQYHVDLREHCNILIKQNHEVFFQTASGNGWWLVVIFVVITSHVKPDQLAGKWVSFKHMFVMGSLPLVYFSF